MCGRSAPQCCPVAEEEDAEAADTDEVDTEEDCWTSQEACEYDLEEF